jgi:hypothetical protein
MADGRVNHAFLTDLHRKIKVLTVLIALDLTMCRIHIQTSMIAPQIFIIYYFTLRTMPVATGCI